MTSSGPAAEAARADFREILGRKGHAVGNTRLAVERLEQAFAEGHLRRTPEIEAALADLTIALEQPEGQKLGGKSAEAARFISRHLSRLLDEA